MHGAEQVNEREQMTKALIEVAELIDEGVSREGALERIGDRYGFTHEQRESLAAQYDAA